MRPLRHISLWATLCLLITGCGPDTNTFRMEGNIKGMNGGNLLIYNLDSDKGKMDTISIKEGDFRYAGNISHPTIYTIVFPNALEQDFVVHGGDELSYKARANDLRNFEVGGNEDNDILNRFRRETQGANKDKERSIAKDYINMHPQSLAAIVLFNRYFVNEDLDNKDCETLLKILMKQQPQNTYLMKLSGEVKKMKRGKTGTEVPKLDLETKKGKKVDIKDKSKPWTLLFFWATWTPRGYETLNMMRNIAKANEDSLHCVGISLDSHIYQWEGPTKADSLIIDHCCDGMAWETPSVQQMGVIDLPTFYLIDSNHKIIYRGSDREEINEEVKKRLKKQENTQKP